MPDESVNAIITDPPYGINYVSQTGARIKNDKAPFIWFLYDAFRVLKSGGTLLCFTRWDVEQTFIDAIELAGFRVKSEVIWDKVYHGMGDTKAAFAPAHENIVFAIKGKYSFPGGRPERSRHLQQARQRPDDPPDREASGLDCKPYYGSYKARRPHP